MGTRIEREWPSLLPAGDTHRYRTGAWRPQTTEWTATDMHVEGEIPTDLNGVYLRNTENPLVPAMERYHPFDGDGMIHAISFREVMLNIATGLCAQKVWRLNLKPAVRSGLDLQNHL